VFSALLFICVLRSRFVFPETLGEDKSTIEEGVAFVGSGEMFVTLVDVVATSMTSSL
jgi:hypothetical protein